MVPAGRLRRRLVLQEEGRVPNGQGGWTTGWQDVGGGKPLRAEVIGLSGDEALQEMVKRNIQQWRVTIRKRPGVTTKNRLKEGALVYDIKSIMDDPREPERFWVLICETGAIL
jgi:SPP1 family predicted phage head-tail adaptor